MREIAKWLFAHDRIAVIPHVFADGDSYGSCLAMAMALRNMGKRAFMACEETMPHMYAFLPGQDLIFSTEKAPFVPECVLHMDTASLDRVGAAFSTGIAFSALIDHHRTNPGFDDVCWIDGGASSTGEMVTMLFEEMGLPITAEMATCLYTAISTDTGNFQFSNVTAAAMRSVAVLLESGLDIAKASAALFRSRTLARTRLLGEALHAMRLSEDGKIALTLVTREMMQECEAGHPDTESIVNYLNEIEGVLAAAMLEEREGSTKISLRSAETVDVSAVAKMLGGGGHQFAAGATSHMEAEVTAQLVWNLLREAVG